MTVATLGLFVLGLALLVIGAEALVRGASKLAVAAGVSPLVIGLTVVAFGTSAPELAVSVQSALQGQANIAVGNVVGSNIFNILFILGVSAAITPLLVAQQLVRLDVPLMVGASVLVYIMAFSGAINRWEGAVLFAGVVAYTIFLIRQSRAEQAAIQAEYTAEFGDGRPKSAGPWIWNLTLVIGGLAMLVLGSRWLVAGAVALTEAFGVSDLVIGLTIVAAGTSLPEVATSVVAALRGERDIAVGNAIGSNIFNLLSVLGLTALVAPHGIAVAPSALAFDLPVMVAVAVACLPIFFTGNEISRWEGWLFLGYYAAYTTYLIFHATAYIGLPLFNMVMLFFVLPLTVLTLLITTGRELRARYRLHHTTQR